MKMRIILLIQAVGVGLSACGGASSDSSPQRPGEGLEQASSDASHPTIVPAPVSAMGAGPASAITKKCPTLKNEEEIVLSLNANKKMFKDFANNKEFPRDVTVGGVPQINPPDVDPNAWATNLDADFSLKDPTNTYTKITVRLMPEGKIDALFLRPNYTQEPVKDLRGSAAITVQSSMAKYFCGLTDITPASASQPYETISFGMTLPPGQTASYNIGILISKTTPNKVYWTPIFIDPNVKNRG